MPESTAVCTECGVEIPLPTNASTRPQCIRCTQRETPEQARQSGLGCVLFGLAAVVVMLFAVFLASQSSHPLARNVAELCLWFAIVGGGCIIFGLYLLATGASTDEINYARTRFEHNAMLARATRTLKVFAAAHRGETFYVLAVDANVLCLNSVEVFRERLAYYQSRTPKEYSNPATIEALKYDPADWKYRRFSVLRSWNGFCRAAYTEHRLELRFPSRNYHSDYRDAMHRLLKDIGKSAACRELKKTDDFKLILIDRS